MSEKGAIVTVCYIVLKTEKMEKKRIEAVYDVKTTKAVIFHPENSIIKAS